MSVQPIMLGLVPNFLGDAEEFSQLYNKHEKAFKLREKMTNGKFVLQAWLLNFLKCKLLWVGIVLFTNKLSFLSVSYQQLLSILFVFPVHMLEFVNVLSCLCFVYFSVGIKLSNMVASLTNVIIVFINICKPGCFLISELISVLYWKTNLRILSQCTGRSSG